ncbi:MAG: nucleotide-binding protein [Eubacterium sp.]|nr:nucleotide-binding protein [Eubacterium sp.]
MGRTIFYSWQTDLDSKNHKNYIEKCLKLALKKLKTDVSIFMDYDRDTMGINGSPDITSTIFDKIGKSALFVCDISIINSSSKERKTPNPNVLLELGYAASKLGWDKIICLFDSNTGKIEDLPFDIRQKRVTPFDPTKNDEVNRVTQILTTNIKDLYLTGKLFNPLNDYIKGKIDRSILSVAKQMANLVYGTITLSDGLAHVDDLLNCNLDEIKTKICCASFPSFIVLNDFSSAKAELQSILKDLLSSSYFPKEWCFTVLEMLDWIRMYAWFVSHRNTTFPFDIVNTLNYNHLAPISGYAMNRDNPKSSFLILETVDKNGTKYVDTQGGKVINMTNYPTDDISLLKKCFCVKSDCVDNLAEKICNLTSICKDWLDITEGEFILDPDYYEIAATK